MARPRKIKSYGDTKWTLGGVHPRSKDIAKRRAKEEGVNIGTWVSNVICMREDNKPSNEARHNEIANDLIANQQVIIRNLERAIEDFRGQIVMSSNEIKPFWKLW